MTFCTLSCGSQCHLNLKLEKLKPIMFEAEYILQKVLTDINTEVA
mgnify:CR=1 FL=1